MSAPPACPGIRPRVWVVLIITGFTLWIVFAGLAWLVVGWWTS